MSRPTTMAEHILFIDSAHWFGGAQRSLLSLILGLHRETEFVPHLISADSSENGLLQTCRAAGIPSHPVSMRHWTFDCHGFRNLTQDRSQFKPILQQVLQNNRFAIMHANDPRSGLLLLGTVPPGLPLILHARDLRIPQIVRQLLQRKFAHFCAISEPVADLWRQRSRPAAVTIVPNGFDIPAIAASKPAQLPWPQHSQRYVAVMVADMIRWKQHGLFLDALRQAHLPQLRALLVGRVLDADGQQYLKFLRAYCNAVGLDTTVRFITKTDNALPWIAAADVLVSSADREPFGRTLIEALALQKPVVALRNIGLAETLAKSAAALLTDGNAAAVAAGLRWWSEPLLRQQAAAAAGETVTQFSTARMVQQIAELYRKLLSKHPV